jgi:hypothetical protein
MTTFLTFSLVDGSTLLVNPDRIDTIKLVQGTMSNTIVTVDSVPYAVMDLPKAIVAQTPTALVAGVATTTPTPPVPVTV